MQIENHSLWKEKFMSRNHTGINAMEGKSKLKLTN